MNINERILNIANYFVTMQVEPSDGSQLIRIDVRWPDKWFFADDTLEKFNVSIYQQDKGSAMFFCDIKVGFDAAFDAIDYNIKLNLDAQRKGEIYQEKVKLLKELFLDETYTIEQLESLTFNISPMLSTVTADEILPLKAATTKSKKDK